MNWKHRRGKTMPMGGSAPTPPMADALRHAGHRSRRAAKQLRAHVRTPGDALLISVMPRVMPTPAERDTRNNGPDHSGTPSAPVRCGGKEGAGFNPERCRSVGTGVSSWRGSASPAGVSSSLPPWAPTPASSPEKQSQKPQILPRHTHTRTGTPGQSQSRDPSRWKQRSQSVWWRR